MNFEPKRDAWIFAQIFALILTIMVVFAPSVQTSEDLFLWQGLVIGLIGLYGGVKGLGKKKKDPENTFGTYSGLIRILFSFAFLFFFALVSLGYIAGVSEVSQSFVWAVTAEALALAIPALVNNFKG